MTNTENDDNVTKAQGSPIKRQAPTVGFVIFLAILAFLRALLAFTNGRAAATGSLFVLLGLVFVGFAVYLSKSKK